MFSFSTNLTQGPLNKGSHPPAIRFAIRKENLSVPFFRSFFVISEYCMCFLYHCYTSMACFKPFENISSFEVLHLMSLFEWYVYCYSL